MTGDYYPDIPLRFTFEEFGAVIQFPLGFCPGDRSNSSDPQRNFKCRGDWGFVIKMWESITKAFPFSTRNLNAVTMQMDVDIYDGDGNKVIISDMAVDMILMIPRLKVKGPEFVTIQGIVK